MIRFKPRLHITDQIGMFASTGMTPEEVATCTRDYSVYLTKDGNISIAGVTSANMGHLDEAMHSATKKIPTISIPSNILYYNHQLSSRLHPLLTIDPITALLNVTISFVHALNRIKKCSIMFNIIVKP